MFIDQVEEPYAAAIMRPRAGRSRSSTHGYDVSAGAARTNHPLSHSRPRGFCFCGTPGAPRDARYAPLRSLPTFQPARWSARRDPAIPITTVLTGKLDDPLRECIFVFTLHRTICVVVPRGWLG